MVIRRTGGSALAVDARGAASDRNSAFGATLSAVRRVVAGETFILIHSGLAQMAIYVTDHVAFTVDADGIAAGRRRTAQTVGAAVIRVLVMMTGKITLAQMPTARTLRTAFAVDAGGAAGSRNRTLRAAFSAMGCISVGVAGVAAQMITVGTRLRTLAVHARGIATRRRAARNTGISAVGDVGVRITGIATQMIGIGTTAVTFAVDA